jgi:hypothetical protein
MSKALLDTTILTNILLKPQAEGRVARIAVKRFSETLLPQYAIKEFKAGPLRAYIWFHNKIVSCNSWSDAVAAIPLLFMQRNLMNTAMQAMTQFQSSISNRLPSDFAQRYPGQSLGQIMTDEGALWLKTTVFVAWSQRNKIASRVVSSLSCYAERDLKIENSGQIDASPMICGVKDCCLRYQFTSAPMETKKLLDACDHLPLKTETDRRKRVLKDLVRVPDRELAEKSCRALGDAVFALQCPKDAIILTTNIVDHQPLARAVGVDAIAP